MQGKLQSEALNDILVYTRLSMQLNASILFKCEKKKKTHLFYSPAYPGLTCGSWATPDEKIEAEHGVRLIWTTHTKQ